MERSHIYLQKMTATAPRRKKSICPCVYKKYSQPRAVFVTIAAAALPFFTPADCFSPPEIINQVIACASNLPNPATPLNELLFVAANVLDGSKSQGRQKIPFMLSAGLRNGTSTGNKRLHLSVQLPPLTQQSATAAQATETLYDDEVRTIWNTLDLTPQEEALIQMIRRVRNKYSPSTTVRVAGGWVRDKLLYGKDTPSRDIDFVLSDVSGEDFANMVCRYLEETSGPVPLLSSKGASKGEQADHLKTASLIIDGFDVDFCRLRYERYDFDSRIPSSTGVASIVEDAWRRDLTINALYYNINTNQVEDWTEQGLNDLRLQTIATPKKPLPTLLEDPTRILRAIRFAARLSFNLAPGLLKAARDVRVRFAVRYKVSRDTIGSAIDAMFGTQARDPSRGIRLLIVTNLIDVIFPLKDVDVAKSSALYQSGLESLSRTQSLVTQIFFRSPNLDWDISKRRLLWYAAFLKPVYEMPPSSYSGPTNTGKRSQRRDSAFHKLLDALRRPKADVQSIELILKGAVLLRMVLEGERYDAIQSIIEARSRIQDMSPSHDKWEELLELRWSLFQTLKPVGKMWREALILFLASRQSNVSACVEQYNRLVFLIEDQLDLGTILQDNNKAKPLLNGSEIQEILPRVSGKMFKTIAQTIEEWQIRNCCSCFDTQNENDGTQKRAQLIDHLLATFPEYTNAHNEEVAAQCIDKIL